MTRHQDRKQLLPETWVPVSELECKGGKDRPKVAPVFKIPRTKKAGPKFCIRKAHLRKRLGDGRLPCPCETAEPEHPFILFIVQPGFELGEEISPGTLHAPLSVPAEVPSVGYVIHAVEKSEVRSLLIIGYYIKDEVEKRHSQRAYSFCHRCLVVMTSGAEVSHGRGESPEGEPDTR